MLVDAIATSSVGEHCSTCFRVMSLREPLWISTAALLFLFFLVGVKTVCFNHMWLWLARQAQKVGMLASHALERRVSKQLPQKRNVVNLNDEKAGFILVGDLVCIGVLLGNRGHVCQDINRDSIIWMRITLGNTATKSLITMVFQMSVSGALPCQRDVYVCLRKRLTGEKNLGWKKLIKLNALS